VISNAKLSGVVLALLAALVTAAPASAHPHMWITYEMTVDYDKGMVTGVDHIWSFDDAYAGMALEGLDTNNDGTYDQKELEPLLKVNMDGLKEFNYFTVAKLGAEELAFSPPTKARLEYTNKVLKLHFHLSLVKPVFADAQGLTFAVFDPSYFIDFEPEKTNAINLASAPPGCSAALLDPDAEKIDAQSKKLGDAIAQQFGGAAIGFGSYKTVAITCKKS
jgi:ABC-type uncharacterized transport system substrate-binding protein